MEKKISQRHKAKIAKNDEFYTRIEDVNLEMQAYLDFNKDVFRGKTILLPCDDPNTSQFFNFFVQRFHAIGAKKIICTSYNMEGGKGKMSILTEETMPTFKNNDPELSVYVHPSKYPSFDMEDNGDFRSAEVTAYRDEADMIISNVPFSLFREILAWAGDKQIAFIGNMNAITYKETFKMIQEGKLWIGATNFNKAMIFDVPETFEYYGTNKKSIELAKEHKAQVPAICWFTSIEHGRRKKAMDLFTTTEVFRYSEKYKKLGWKEFPKYDNYDAIEVPQVKDIPLDYDGVMGLPITFLGSFNPDQFSIVGMTHRNDWDNLKTKRYTKEEYKNANDLNGGPVLMEYNNPKIVYMRILIKHKIADHAEREVFIEANR